MEKSLDSKMHFNSVQHAWEIFQQFYNLPNDDPALMLDENKIICNPLFIEAANYIHNHGDEDPDIDFYFKSILLALSEAHLACYEQEDGSSKKCEPALNFYKKKVRITSDIRADQGKRCESMPHFDRQLGIDILD
jgi:hypothetical protein